MRQHDCTFELSRRYTGSWSYIQGSTGNHENEGKTNNLVCMLYLVYTVFSVCCTRCMLYSVYAVLGVCCTRCQLMIIRWRDREEWLNFVFCDDGIVVDENARDGDEDVNNVEKMSGYDKSGVRVAWLGWEDLISVSLHAGSGLVPAVSGIVNWPVNEILLSPSFSWWFVPSYPLTVFLVLNCTITEEHEVKSSLSISDAMIKS